MTPPNTLRTFALICVGATSLFIMGVSVWLIYLLQSDWCGRAIEAGHQASAPRPEYAIGACFGLLNQQVAALAWSNHIALGVLAMCLFVLVVIVLAGGRASIKLSKDGLEGDVAPDAAAGAQAAVDGAQDVADQIAAVTK